MLKYNIHAVLYCYVVVRYVLILDLEFEKSENKTFIVMIARYNLQSVGGLILTYNYILLKCTFYDVL